MTLKVLLSTAILVPVFFSVSRYGVASLLTKKYSAVGLDWLEMGPTPLGEKKYTPQGLTWANGRLIFANTWKDRKSRVYEIDPSNMEPLRYFDMPREAVHTSGLAWDGEYLWAVDYRANRAYCIDLEPSMSQGSARVEGSFSTTLQGTSACCILRWKGKEVLAISDFMRSRQTLFVDYRQAIKAGMAGPYIAFRYRNEGFSQGLEFFGGHLYEAENKLGVDVVNQLDLKKLELFGDARKATVAQYRAPSRGVEDLAWSGESLWTSDEVVFRFFKWTP